MLCIASLLLIIVLRAKPPLLSLCLSPFPFHFLLPPLSQPPHCRRHPALPHQLGSANLNTPRDAHLKERANQMAELTDCTAALPQTDHARPVSSPAPSLGLRMIPRVDHEGCQRQAVSRGCCSAPHFYCGRRSAIVPVRHTTKQFLVNMNLRSKFTNFVLNSTFKGEFKNFGLNATFKANS